MIKIKNIPKIIFSPSLRRKFWTIVGKSYLFSRMVARYHKKKVIFSGAVLLVAAGTFFGILAWKNYKASHDPKNQPQIYEALVNVVDQKSKDPAEDARSSLKKGDVIAYFPEGHPWSETERISYLIVKIKLKPDEATKLTEAETKETARKEIPNNQQDQNQQNNQSSVWGKFGKKDDNQPAIKDMGPQTETVLARQYRLDLPGYDLQKFWESHEQPFSDRTFSSSIIEKK